MAPESAVEFTELTHLEFQPPCDYGDQPIHRYSGDAGAEWILFVACECGGKARRLACTHCKDHWIETEESAECRYCGWIATPARELFWDVEPI